MCALEADVNEIKPNCVRPEGNEAAGDMYSTKAKKKYAKQITANDDSEVEM